MNPAEPHTGQSTSAPVGAEAHGAWIAAARREAARCMESGTDQGASPASAELRMLAESLSGSLPGYEIGELIQRGGQGVVLRGVQRGTGRSVAIKVMRGGTLAEPQHRARFDREVQILARLKHPNIVTILDCGSVAGQFYYTMDFIPGPALDRYVVQKSLSPRQTAELFAKVCDAVNAAHLRGIIHRDLKPGNIRVDPGGEPHVLDFGLAKMDEVRGEAAHAGEGRTLTGEFVGTPPWASPEQVDGRSDRIDVRTDVYSLGVMMYEALTGEFPYRVDGPLRELLDNIVNAEPARPSTRNPRVDDELDAIVLNCLRKSPDHRYQSAGELARDLRRYLNGEPIEAKRDSSWYMFRTTIRRHRTTASLLALAAGLVLTIAGGSTVMYHRESRLRVQTQQAREEAAHQAQIAQAVNEFLNKDVIAAARPDKLGRSASVESVIDAAAATLDGRFENEPLVEAAIRATIGDVFMELGKWSEAIVHAERALALRRGELGEAAYETLSTMNLCGRLYRRLGRYHEADLLFERMRATATRVLGPEHEMTLKGMNNHAYVLYQLGRHVEARDLNRRVLEIRLRTLGGENEETLTSMNNDAFYTQAAGDREEAARRYVHVLEARRRVLGSEHPDTLMSMHNLATIRMRLGRLDEAQLLEEEHLRLVRRIQGPRHAMTMEALSTLGDVYRGQGRLADAEAAFREALDIQQEIGGPNHPQLAWRLDNLANVYVDQQRYDEAERAYRQALDMLTATVGQRHSKTSSVKASLGALYLEQGRLDEAKPLLTDAYRELAEDLGPDHHQTRRVAESLTKLDRARGHLLAGVFFAPM